MQMSSIYGTILKVNSISLMMLYSDWERGYNHRIKRSLPSEYWNILVDFAEEVVDKVGGLVHCLVEDIYEEVFDQLPSALADGSER